jgi:hypothetical protein
VVNGTADQALERLADELGSGGYATILTRSPAPALRVVNRQAPTLTEDVSTDDGWFRGAATGLIAPCEDIPTAARAVARAVSGQTS